MNGKANDEHIILRDLDNSIVVDESIISSFLTLTPFNIALCVYDTIYSGLSTTQITMLSFLFAIHRLPLGNRVHTIYTEYL